MQTLAIFLLSTFCAGAVAWVVIYPYLSVQSPLQQLRCLRPVAPNKTKTGRAQNRRVVIRVLA